MNWLKELRTKKKMTQVEFAEELGVTQSYVSKIEAYQLDPNYTFLLDLRYRFKFDVNKLLDKINKELD